MPKIRMIIANLWFRIRQNYGSSHKQPLSLYCRSVVTFLPLQLPLALFCHTVVTFFPYSWVGGVGELSLVPLKEISSIRPVPGSKTKKPADNRQE
jgi:hypothetical protein